MTRVVEPLPSVDSDQEWIILIRACVLLDRGNIETELIRV